MQRDQDSYSSPAMQARRQRILEETRALIAEQGIDGFRMMDLCRRADVAKQTLYYAFGSKNLLIASAIRDFFEEYERAIPYHSPSGTLERMIERIVAISQRNLHIRHYVAAIVTFYYGSAASPELWATLHDIITLPQRPYVEALARQRQLQPWIDPQQLIDALDGQRLSVSNDWIHSRISDEDMIDRMVLGHLTYLLGSVKGAARRKIEATLGEISKTGALAYVDRLPTTASDNDLHGGEPGQNKGVA